MKATIPVIMACALLFASFAWAQQSPMYDPNYGGPRNYYGQPVFKPMYTPGAQQPPQQQQYYGQDGLIFRGARRAYSVGEYLWSWLPAPVRGAESPYQVPPGSGQTIVNFVPGTMPAQPGQYPPQR
ncbi:MAG: hypothetical protein AB1473_17545 [Thermodesulfobacteriota bacterium]